MGDFILDFRTGVKRNIDASPIEFCSGTRTEFHDRGDFTLVTTSTAAAELWSSYSSPEDGILVALSGRIALDEQDWQRGAELPGQGGIACKTLYQRFCSGGVEALLPPNGACAVHVHDPRNAAYYLITDPSGAYPCFQCEPSSGGLILASHPDALAGLAGVAEGWDRTSLAEFLVTGMVSPPYSYYEKVHSIEPGSVHTIALGGMAPSCERPRKYFEIDFRLDPSVTEEELAVDLGKAIGRATERRTLPRLGRVGVALSGGLDSRTILCSVPDGRDVLSFCGFDEENVEYRTAEAIAQAVGGKFIPFRRGFEHYGSHAELAVRISGGMGDVGNNHFLGFRESLESVGIDVLLTGCYFDYLFKGLALDTEVSSVSRRERLGCFRWESYHPHFFFQSDLCEGVRERLEKRIPSEMREDSSELGRLRIAALRTFPLCREGDNLQRLIPQRVMDWYAPAIDTDILEVYRRVPASYRLNRSMFTKAVELQCGPQVLLIPDANTGLPICAHPALVSISRYRIALRRALERRRSSIATQESWPNWGYYLQKSVPLRSIWERPDPRSEELFREIMGGSFSAEIGAYRRSHSTLLLRLLTLKIWMDQRDSGSYTQG